MMFLRKALVVLSVAICTSSHAQKIETIAGGGGDGLPARQAHLYGPSLMRVDAAGDLLVLDRVNGPLRRISKATGIITTVAGSSQRDGMRPGTPLGRAGLEAVYGLSVDSGGAIFLSDALAHRILRIAPGGTTLELVAGTGEKGFSGDGGPASAAHFDTPYSIAMTPSGDLYVVDYGNRRIRKIAAGTGIVTTVATIPSAMGKPVELVADGLGNLFFTVLPDFSSSNDAVVKLVIATGALSVHAGRGRSAFAEGVPATSVSMRPTSLAIGPGGDLLVADANERLWKVAAATGALTTFAGGGTGPALGNGGPAIGAYLPLVSALAFDAGGSLFVAHHMSIRRIDAGTGIIDAYAGDERYLGDGQPATNARVIADGMAADAAGNLYLAGFTYGPGSTVRRIDATTSVVTTVPNAYGNRPCMAFFPNGDLATCYQNGVERIDLSSGVRTTYAGGLSTGGRNDGALATQSFLRGVIDIAIDANGVLYILDEDDARVRRVDPATGVITTFFGGGTAQGDGGPATAAVLGANSTGLAVDPAGRLLVSQSGAIRRVDPTTGIVTSVLKYGGAASAFEGPAPSVNMVGIGYVTVDAAGNIYFGDTTRVRRLSATTDFVSTIAGYGQLGYGGDGGPATAAELYPSRLALDGRGGLLMEDRMYQPVRSNIRRIELKGLAVAPGRGTFWDRLPGTTSLPVRFTVSNLGPTPITVTGATANAGFQITHECATIPAYGHCFATVKFAPTALGKVSGQVAIVAGAESYPAFLEGAGEASLVTHFYESSLRRVPDAPGKAFWEGERTRLAAAGANPHEAWFAMASFFYASAEYAAFNRDAPGFVTDLYRTFFNREPDGPGLSFWTGELDAGLPREVVLAQFMLSLEFSSFVAANFGMTSVRREVDVVMDFYRGLLSRLPDNGGLGSWVASFRVAQCKGAVSVKAAAGSLAAAFAFGPEYAARGRNHSQFVGDLYNAFLRRGGERTGVQFWIDALDAGALTRSQVLAAFLDGAEFQSRLAAVAAEPCLP